MNDLQQRIQALLEQRVASGNDRGAQVAVYHRGRLIVDAAAGTLDAHSGRTVTPATLFPVFSTGKGIAATVVHRLVQRRVLDYDRPIAHYWPQFAANGKSAITLRQALDHTAGLWRMPADLTVAQLCHWPTICERLAAMAPDAPPPRYHAMTYGWIIGETARRADGRDFARLVTDEIARPLGIEREVFFGLPDPAPPVAVLETAIAYTPPAVEDPAIPLFVQPLEPWMNDLRVQRACIPASNAIATARALARHYAALLPDGIDAVRLLDDATRAAATSVSSRVGEAGIVYGLGYALFGPPDAPSTRFGHAGYGGSIAWADTRRNLAFALTKNRGASPLPLRRDLEEILNGI